MPEYKVAKCYHCNNETLMEIRDKNKIENGSFFDDDYFYDFQIVLFCPICHNYNIINAYWDYTFGKTNDSNNIYDGDAVEETYLYPITSNLISQKSDLIPRCVLINFEKAIQLKNIDEESSLVKLRKTLEMICNDQNATGNNLYQMLSNLAETGKLPSTLNSASRITRKLGNIGAHSESLEISSSELLSVIELVEYIIQYIYVLPKEIERLEKKFQIQEI